MNSELRKKPTHHLLTEMGDEEGVMSAAEMNEVQAETMAAMQEEHIATR